METGPEPGLRERKKQRTREAIFEAAMELFDERGYDHVTLAEVARAADVAPATVFTHYASKEDLVYSMRHEVNERLRTAVNERAGQIGVLAAVKEWMLGMHEYFTESPEAVRRSRTFSRLLNDNPALWNRSVGFIHERQMLLVELLAERYPDADPFLLEAAAAQVAAATQTAVRYYQRDLAQGMAREEVLARAAVRADQVFEQLERGLGDVF
ncbi:helix-turn-helix domain-containing protein [Catenulispora subtropica]|uniref:HTH tetR-type domain-containing protein n=1 Tax=Catenulispora subtropica TaxID=450798 RepID=A0ABP5ETP8_9ACTN